MAFSFSIYLGFVIFVFFIVGFSDLISRKNTAVDTSETDIQIWLLLLIGSTVVIASLVLFIVVANHIVQDLAYITKHLSFSVIRLTLIPIALILLFPVISCYAAYTKNKKSFQAKFRIYKPEEDNPTYRKLLEYVNGLSNVLNVTKKLHVRISKIKYNSPMIYAITPNDIFLIFPENFFDVIKKRIEEYKLGRIRGIEKLITKYVIIHELSHALNMDSFLFTYLTVFVRMLKYYTMLLTLAVLLIISVLLSYYSFKHIPVLIHYETIRLYIPLLLLSIFARISFEILKDKRELLADSRSSIYFNDKELGVLTDKFINIGNKRYSVLELILGSFKNMKDTMRDHSGKAIMKLLSMLSGLLSLDKLIKIIYKPSSSSSRIAHFRGRVLNADTRAYPSNDTMILIGIELSAIFSLSLMLFQMFNKVLPSYGWYVEFEYAFLLNSVLIIMLINSAMIALPLKNISNNIEISVSFIRGFLPKFGLLLVSFAITTALALFLLVIFNVVFLDLSYFVQILVGYLICIIGVVAVYFILAALKNVVPENYLKENIYNTQFLFVGIAVLLSAVMGTKILLLGNFRSPLSLDYNIFLIVWAMLLWKTKNLHIDFKFVEDVLALKVAGRAYYYEVSKINWLTRIIAYLFISSAYTIMVWIVPFAIFHYLYSYFQTIIADTTLFSILGSQTTKIVILTILLLVAWNESRKKTGSKSFKHNEWLTWNTRLADVLGYDIKDKRQMLNELGQKNVFNKLKDNLANEKYVIKIIKNNMIDIKETERVAYLYSVEEKEEKVEWSNIAMIYENPNGGFGHYRGSPPRLEATFEALSIIKSSNATINKLNTANHMKWILSKLKEKIRMDHKKNNGLLADAHYALASIALLDKDSQLHDFKNKIAEIIIRLWKNGERNIRDTWFLLRSLELLNYHDKIIINEILEYWLPVARNIALNSRIDNQYQDRFKLVGIMVMLNLKNDLLVQRTKEDFERSYFFKKFQLDQNAIPH